MLLFCCDSQCTGENGCMVVVVVDDTDDGSFDDKRPSSGWFWSCLLRAPTKPHHAHPTASIACNKSFVSSGHTERLGGVRNARTFVWHRRGLPPSMQVLCDKLIS